MSSDTHFRYGSRKRIYGPSYNPRVIRPRVAKMAAIAYRRRVPVSQRGYLRTGGYFGRFNTGGAYSRLRRGGYNRPEHKFFDTVVAGTFTAAEVVQTGGGEDLLAIAQGTTESTRIGRKIIVKSIHCQGRVTHAGAEDSATIPNPLQIKLSLIWDKQANGAVPANTDVYETTDILHFNNLANKGRFVTLYTFEENLAPLAAGGTGVTGDWSGETKSFEFHKKCHIPIMYDSTTGAVTEIKSNNLFWTAVANTTQATSGFTIRNRIRFVDS